MNTTAEKGGHNVRQTALQISAAGPVKPMTAILSASLATGKVLVTFAEAGAMLGVSERKAQIIVPTLVTPVVLGPRCVRIVRAELEAAVANLPRRTDPVEPVQLLKARVAKLKRDGVAA